MNLPHEVIAMIAAGSGVFLFVWVGLRLFRTGWKSYESKYIAGAEETLNAMYLTLPAQHLVYLSVLTGIIALLMGLLLGLNPVLGVLMGGFGLAVPMVIIRMLKKKRDLAFNNQLVDSLMSVSNSLKAGFTLPQAFDVLAREMPNPMRQEMRLLTQELRLGVEIDEALNNLYRRMPSADLDLVVTAISIVRGIGGNLTEVFDNISHTIRERMRIEGRIKALTAQGRAQALVMCLLPVGVGLAMHFTMPGSMESLFTTAAGGIVLGVAIIVELIGIFMIRKIITIDV